MGTGAKGNAAHPFDPNAPLSRRSFVASPKPASVTPQPRKEEKPTENVTAKPKPKPLPLGGGLLDRPLSSPIPAEAYPEFADIRSRHWPNAIDFLRRFKAHLLCYIPDGESSGALPIVHTYGVDGLTPKTVGMPNPQMQDQGYGMFFSVNGFKNDKRRNEANLYSLNAFYADIDWPDKANPPTNAQMAAFKRAVFDDLVFCVGQGRDAFTSDPLHAEHCPPPTAIVETKNGFHVYWLFETPVFVDLLRPGSDKAPGEDGPDRVLLEKYKSVQSAIIDRFQADPQCKDTTRVLRVPGSFHLKDRANPFAITLRQFDPENVYSFEQMADFWLRNPNATNPSYAFHHAEEFRKKVQANRQARVHAPKPSGPFKGTGLSAAEGLSEDDLAALDRLFPISERPSFKALSDPTGIAEGSRNKSLLIAASLLRRSGADEDAVLERFGKGYNGLPPYEIRNTIRSAFAGERPYDFGWNDPVLAEHVTLEEASKVREIVKGLMEAKRKAKKDPERPPKKDEGAEESEQASTGPALSVADIKQIEQEYQILDKNTQKRLYNVYDRLFRKYHPDIVSVDDVGFFRHDAARRVYVPISEDGIRRIVSEDLAVLGCLEHRGTGNISAKVESLQAFREIRMAREESEAVLFSDGRSGTVVNTLSGFVDLDSGAMLSDATRLFVTSVLPVTYDPSKPTTPELLEAMCPRWLQFIREVTASSIPGEAANKAALLQEMAGYCFTPYTLFQTAFFLLGSGSNGKSTFLDAIIAIIGQEDTATLSLDDISSQFRLSGLYRKRLNVIEEISNNYFESDNLKKIISGQEVTADRKFMQPIRFRPTAKLVFALNSFPRVNDQSHALYRRFKTIPFNVTFDGAAKDYSLPQRLYAERDGIFRWCMEGWQRLRLNGRFTHSLEAQESGEDFKVQNSPLVEFLLRDCLTYEEAASRHPATMAPLMREDFIVTVEALYAAYRTFAKDNAYGVKSRQSFLREMASLTHSSLKGITLSPTFRSAFLGLRLRSKLIPTNEPNSRYAP